MLPSRLSSGCIWTATVRACFCTACCNLHDMRKCITSTAASSSTAVSVLRHGSAPPDLQTDTAGEACVWQLDTCTHVTAAQHVLYIDARARHTTAIIMRLQPKVSAVHLVSS